MKKEIMQLKGYLIESLFTIGLMILYALIVWVMIL